MEDYEHQKVEIGFQFSKNLRYFGISVFSAIPVMPVFTGSTQTLQLMEMDACTVEAITPAFPTLDVMLGDSPLAWDPQVFIDVNCLTICSYVNLYDMLLPYFATDHA